MRRPRQTLAAALLLPLLAACGGAPQASDPPSASSPSSASSATPTPPEVPIEAKERTRRGAIAAAEHFLTALNYAGANGDTQPFRGSYTEFCTRCEAIADGIDATYEAGGSIEGAAWTPRRFKYYGIVDGVAVVDALVDVAPEVFQSSANAKPQRSKGNKNVLKALQLDWRPQTGWAVAALDPRA